LPFFAKLPACLIGIEACATAHYWARELGALGHLVKLIPPSYMKPNVKRQKNDAADAEAICEAVTRPMMLFVEVKSPEQQSVMVLHKVRLTLMFQRIQLSNTIRGHIAEFGLVAPIGRAGLQQLIKPEESDPCVPDEEGCAWSRRSMQGFGTSCSTAKSSTPSPGRRSSSKAGGATSIRCARMARSDTSRRLRRSSSPPWPRGRLRNPDQLRRPR